MSHYSHMIFKYWSILVMASGLAAASAQEAQPDPARILEGARISDTLTKLEEGLNSGDPLSER